MKKYEDGKIIYWKNEWFCFYPGFKKLNFTIAPAGYFDNRAQVNFSFGWGQFYIDIPFIKSKYDECDPPRYGFYFYSVDNWFPDSFVICLGKKTKFYYLPWCYDWYRTSIMMSDESWVHETKKDRKDFYKKEWDNNRWKAIRPYVYTTKKGDIQLRNATIKVDEREWRPKWFMWTKLFSKVKRSIDVEFDGEIGERVGSWKGGTLGCGYTLMKGETPYQCLRRMESEREFR